MSAISSAKLATFLATASMLRRGWRACASQAGCASHAPSATKSATSCRSPSTTSSLMAVMIAGGGAWWIVRTPPTGAPAPAAPVGGGRASIAVLPLEALGAEGGSDYFADGLTEDIIAALGRFRDLSVMSLGA